MATETVEGAAIRFDRPSAAAALRPGETSLPDHLRRAAALRGTGIALALIALAAVGALLFTAVTFGYSIGELL